MAQPITYTDLLERLVGLQDQRLRIQIRRSLGPAMFAESTGRFVNAGAPNADGGPLMIELDNDFRFWLDEARIDSITAGEDQAIEVVEGELAFFIADAPEDLELAELGDLSG